ncbi:hypothetical protein G6N05_06045 [Flavobacterium sp. F372]|uniref:Anti-sigma factor n=1 Tax=Flavobacterium bernardetii TaxID=2813823 RepID=A0ABR7J0D8_9FLAO|nr:hypothetical protein [Flavobacterium bernardetii]MBC5835324.1 hypothetical protein [Flavobacterium bernardetii]NHF69669.1 hypothetical protein [Flavobacterium bernardetii]
MEPNNFDNNIQQKFNSREIEPSAQAWDRLDAMLTVAEEKKQPKNYFWLKIAASFLLFTGMGYVFFQQNQKSETLQPTNEVVISKETPTNEVENSDDTEIIILPETQNELAIATPKATNSATKKVSKQNDNSKYKSKFDSYLAVTEKLKEAITKNENNNKYQEQTNQKNTHTNVNSETLLAEVQGNKKPDGNTTTHKSTLKVNPNDLLNSVESELDQSLKDKALTKFKQAKSAFVNRNYN